VVADVPVLWVTGTGVSTEPARGTQRKMLEHRGRKAHTVLDLDYRPMFWSDVDSARREIGWMLDHVTVAVGNRTEVEVAVGTADPDEAARRMLDRGVRLALVKKGAEGVLVATPEGSWTVPPHPIDVVCGLGAGDAFGGALVHGLLAGWEPVRMARYANIAGALVAGRLACADAMPEPHEIEELL
jgi:5-dehydro-2-deoxygluconokinase